MGLTLAAGRRYARIQSNCQYGTQNEGGSAWGRPFLFRLLPENV
jgi:hypothetical protein